MITQGIAAQATAMQMENTGAKAGMQVAKMSLDTAEATGEAIVEMIQDVSEIYDHLGQNVNTKA